MSATGPTSLETSAEARIADCRERVLAEGVILCIRLTDGSRALDACRAAARGGLTVLEVTLTTPGALEWIAELASEDGLLVGAGTVLAPEQTAAVADAGGRFIMSPVFDPDVVDEAHRSGLLAVPGAATPREILAAYRHGATLVKVFPSEQLGGPTFLRRVRGPLPQVPLVPTSGPTARSIGDYVAAGACAVGVGPDVVKDGFVAAQVESAAREVRAAMERARSGF